MFNLYETENENYLQKRLIARVEKYLDLKRWKFHLTYKTHKKGYVAIYNSPSCRLRFSLSLDPREQDDSINISYGRSHAPDEEYHMVYQGENCKAWHDFLMGYVGQFLDEMEPQVLARASMERIEIPSQAKKKFEESEIARGLRSPVWGLKFLSYTWEYYGDNLFDLFDLRHPEKWDVYRKFLKEYYGELAKDSYWLKNFTERPKWRPAPWYVC